MKTPEVKLLLNSPSESQILSSIYIAAKGCYSDRSAWDIESDITQAKVDFDTKFKLFQRLWKDRHRTTLTHINFTFSFNYVPIKIATQLTRTQVGVTFDQRSTRYLAKWTKGNRGYDYGVQPINVRDEAITGWTENDNYNKLDMANKLIEECYSKCAETYEQLRALGIIAEDAAYVLNLGAFTGLTATFNLVSFRHWINTRLLNSTGKAQGEHSELAKIALKAFAEAYPNLHKEMFGDINVK